MSLMKSIFAVLLLTAIVSIVPKAQAAVTVEVTIAGSSAMWQTLALGAFAEAGTGAGHWTSASNAVNLTDTRLTPVNVDPGTIWIVWNSTGTKVWSFNKVDSVVGDRCYFAQPHCTVSATAANLSGSGAQQISSVLWGADTALPASISALFTTGTLVNVAATDIRPEDAAFAVCRVNSLLGAGTNGGSASDGLDGLGYNSVNASGVCPASGLGDTSGAYLGNPIKSGYPGSTTVANVLSFNIKGSDPISGTTIPAFTVAEVGATPVVFITARQSALADLRNASTQQLQQAFSGTNCDASVFGLPAAGIGIFLREPLSGTYNTAEATVFRHPTVYPGAILGLSQDANVDGAVNNPLAGQSGTCVAGTGKRYRAIGTSEEVKSVLNSVANLGLDGIGYTFFSYGNVSSIANSTAYGYITLNNIDPIFASYGPQNSTGTGYDPGQPATAGTLPAAANLPSSCGAAFPCPENDIWAGGLSFPNLRNGTYPAWSVVRLVSNGTGLTNAKALIVKSQAFVVTSVPDYVPFTKTTAGGITDPGLLLVRSHYQEYDGAGTFLGAAPVNTPVADEAGGDAGGVILPCTTVALCSKTTQQVQGTQGLQVRP
ncbi:MAG TPA: hypothetical protein VN946_17555 [Terriglobales bacterium]|jgi:hypothetical protein|nr:hypothetical protein [Terriglobales bacterium]